MMPTEIISIKLPARANRGPIHATVVLPDFDFPTQQARAILPTTVDRRDAIYNISRAVMVTEALRTGDVELLGKAMTDGEAAAMTCVDEALQADRSTIRMLHGKREDAVIAPVTRPGKLSQRQQFDCRHAQFN